MESKAIELFEIQNIHIFNSTNRIFFFDEITALF